MAVSLNSANIFSPTVNYQPTTRPYIRVLLLKVHSVSSLSPPVKLNFKISRIHHRLAVGGETEPTEKDSKPVQGLNSNDEPSSSVAPNIKENRLLQNNEASQSSNGPVYPDPSLSAPNPSLTSKRAPLTARERLRAARVLNRYNDSKPTKTGLRSNFLEALRNSDNEGNRKRSGLPEAPSNLFDDSKKGLPKEGWTINLPGERSGRTNNEQGSCTNRTSKQRSGRECKQGAKKCRLRGTQASTHHTADWSSPEVRPTCHRSEFTTRENLSDCWSREVITNGINMVGDGEVFTEGDATARRCRVLDWDFLDFRIWESIRGDDDVM
ncbi:Unknown protein [Striga hermonthica]|uniref:Uncharacterized protein n=1 Tax=Striga hermonthica TaxID=68872 RepID=A0A9N7MX64_STRHE|nr:Unknown protein [Striga hermonthica]